ncbi:hypothetical protein GGI12_003215 [Dipsacomyces acuminosporus]|nr:hypothetical protein GGI12_003215 [Dipsacomyces acuminosporus]
MYEWGSAALEPRRETLEECGIQIDNVEHVATTNDIFSPALHYVTLFQSAQIKDCDKGKAVKIMEPEKCLGWIWIKWSELVAGRAVYRDACVSDDDGSKQQQQQQTMTVCFDSEPLFLPLLSVKKQYAGRVPEWLC